jgi:hypothetical protein
LGHWNLELGTYLGFGAWDLEFYLAGGSQTTPLRLDIVLGTARRAPTDMLLSFAAIEQKAYSMILYEQEGDQECRLKEL